jgi:hypothetical protein
MQLTTTPLAFVCHENNRYHVYALRTEVRIEVKVTLVIPNDYTKTNLEMLFPSYEEEVYSLSFPDFSRNEIEAVRYVVNYLFDQVMSSIETYGTGTKFNSDFVYYSPSRKTTIDCLHWFTGLTMYCQKNYDDVISDYSDAVLLNVDDAILEMENAYIDKVARKITKEQFWDALECLPPQNWVRRECTESFKMSEYLSGNITGIYVRIGEEYFTFHDRASMTHSQIVEKTQAGMICQLTSV